MNKIQKIPTNQKMRIEYGYYILLLQRSRDNYKQNRVQGGNGGNNGSFVRIQLGAAHQGRVSVSNVIDGEKSSY